MLIRRKQKIVRLHLWFEPLTPNRLGVTVKLFNHSAIWPFSFSTVYSYFVTLYHFVYFNFCQVLRIRFCFKVARIFHSLTIDNLTHILFRKNLIFKFANNVGFDHIQSHIRFTLFSLIPNKHKFVNMKSQKSKFSNIYLKLTLENSAYVIG